MKKKLQLGILIMFLCTLFTAAGQLFFKFSSASFKWNPLSMITNYNLMFGFFLYAIGAGLLIISLKFGDLSVIFPFVSLNFIWVAFLSFLFLEESINYFKVWGIIFIIFGVVLISRGGGSGK